MMLFQTTGLGISSIRRLDGFITEKGPKKWIITKGILAIGHLEEEKLAQIPSEYITASLPPISPLAGSEYQPNIYFFPVSLVGCPTTRCKEGPHDPMSSLNSRDQSLYRREIQRSKKCFKINNRYFIREEPAWRWGGPYLLLCPSYMAALALGED